jgi:hypothetical protein
MTCGRLTVATTPETRTSNKPQQAIKWVPADDKGAAMWSYPVLRECCSCGAYTEAVAVDTTETIAAFAAWRKDHRCKSQTKGTP